MLGEGFFVFQAEDGIRYFCLSRGLVDVYKGQPNNTLKIGALALLSGKELASFNTIDDYLFGRLWRALQQEDPARQIEMIGASIRQYGPDYFGAEVNGGWGYALLLSLLHI